MPTSSEALINRELLVWARESAGMDLEEAAGKLGISVRKLQSWEDGSERPTIKKLRKVASVYRQSFAAFYLPEPPDAFHPPLRDYRRLPDALGEMSSDLLFDIRLAMDRRGVCLELYAEQRESPPEFEWQTRVGRDPEQVGDQIRGLLGVSFEQQRNWKDARLAFNAWREAIESNGVLVFQSTSVYISEMRGYSMAIFPLPVIVVNRKDALAGRSFTMLHELVHLMLRSSGLCDLDSRPDRAAEEQNTEVFCNHVAGTILVPKARLLAEALVRTHKGRIWEDDELELLSSRYGASREVILRRLLILGLTDDEFYETKRDQFQREYRSRPKGEGFVPPAIDVVSAAGKPFVRLVLDAYYGDRITASDVSDYLGVKLSHLEKIGHAVGLE